MTWKWAFRLAFIFALGGMCWHYFGGWVPEVDDAKAEALEMEADDLWGRFGQNSREWVALPDSEWPPAIAAMNPKVVMVSSEGVYIQLHSFFVESKGIFVLRKGSSFVPRRESDPSYRPLNGRLYSYEIKG